MSATTAYLDILNSAQRVAVEHGIAGPSCTTGGPLLVIAGAGSGKTSTLARRVGKINCRRQIDLEKRGLLISSMSRECSA